MKVLKDQNKKMINKEDINNKTNIDNDDVREKIKNLIKKKNYNLRDLSRNIKKNDAYLQQYLYRGTPKVLPEEYRYLLAELLDVNVNELIPSWLKNISSQEEFFIGELARLQTILVIYEDKEEYEKAALILNKIKKIMKKLGLNDRKL